MAVRLEPVGSRYGAPMGRVATLPSDYVGRLHVARVPIDRGGYDSAGAYWGLGKPLYQARGADRGEAYFRAPDRAAALAIARDICPAARVRA